MTIRGHVENGVVVLDDPVKLEDGTPVTVEVTASSIEGELHPDVVRFTGIWPPHASIAEAYDPGRF